MGYFKNLHIDLLDLYSKAEQNYLIFARDMDVTAVIGEKPYNADTAIAAAQYYGMMCGYMNAEKAIFQSNVIEEEMKELGVIKLYESDFKEESS